MGIHPSLQSFIHGPLNCCKSWSCCCPGSLEWFTGSDSVKSPLSREVQPRNTLGEQQGQMTLTQSSWESSTEPKNKTSGIMHRATSAPGTCVSTTRETASWIFVLWRPGVSVLMKTPPACRFMYPVWPVIEPPCGHCITRPCLLVCGSHSSTYLLSKVLLLFKSYTLQQAAIKVDSKFWILTIDILLFMWDVMIQFLWYCLFVCIKYIFPGIKLYTHTLHTLQIRATIIYIQID